jgi:hypothetical protein
MKKVASLLCTAVAAGVTAVCFVNCSSGEKQPPPAGEPVFDAGTTPPSTTGTEAGTGGITVTPTDIKFGEDGMVDCGSQGATETLILTNGTTKNILFKAKLTEGSDNYTLSPDSVSVAAGAVGTLQVIPKAIPSKSDVKPELYSGNVEVSATEGAGASGAANVLSVTNVKLHQTARGAILASTVSSLTAFTGRVGTTKTQHFSVTNTGNVPVDLKFSVGGPVFTVTDTAKVDVNATAVQDVNFTATAQQPYTDTLTVSIVGNTALCGEPIASKDLTATGTNQVDVDKGSLAFGKVNCGSAAPFQALTIDNSGTAMQFTPVFGKGNAADFTLQDGAGNEVPTSTPTSVGPSTTYTLRVVPKTVVAPVLTTPDGLSDKLTITTNSAGDAPHVVQLTETAQGAYISMNAPSYKVVDGNIGHSAFTNVVLTNSGNLPGTYTIVAKDRDGVPFGTFTLNSGNGSLAAGGTQTLVMTTKTPGDPLSWGPMGSTCQLLGDITLTPSAVALCSDAQPVAPLSLECK